MPFKPKKQILIVEDDEDCRSAYKTILESEGYAVTEAADGDQALEKIGCHEQFCRTYDLCILDLMIPGKTGDVVADIIKYERLCLTPILVITGMAPYQLHPYEDKLKQIQGFLAKPFNIEEFLHVVRAMTLKALGESAQKAREAA